MEFTLNKERINPRLDLNLAENVARILGVYGRGVRRGEALQDNG